jgi:spore coat protein CotF
LTAVAACKAATPAVRETRKDNVKRRAARFIDSNYNITSCKNQKFAYFPHF